MRQRCVQAVQQAIGRPLRAAEDQRIMEDLRLAMRQLQAQDPAAFAGMTEAQRLTQAATIAGQRLQADVALRQRRAALTILAHQRIDDMIASSPHSGLGVLNRLMAFDADQKAGVMSIEAQRRAIRAYGISRMADAMDQNNGAGWRLFGSVQGVQDIVRESHGQRTGNADAARVAQAFRDIAEQNRQRFNAAGGNIGHLEDWGVPHSHSQIKIARAGITAWVNFVRPLLDRNRYTNPDGSRMSDTQFNDFLESTWTTLATNGVNKLEPGKSGGTGARANRGSEHRQIHFRDGDAWIRYQQEFGERDLIGTMLGHIDGMSKDIALVENLGPNPANTLKLFLDREQRAAAVANPADEPTILKQRTKIEGLYAEVAGTRPPPVSRRLADNFAAYRALNVAARLGSAALTSITDQGVMGTVAGMNRLPVTKVFSNEIKFLNPANGEHRVLARRAGLGVEQMLGSLSRWGADGLGDVAEVSSRLAKVSNKLAEKVMQLSGMNALMEGAQRAFGSVMLDTLGSLTRTAQTIGDLHADDARLLRAAGITDLDWSVWRLAQPEDFRGAGDTVLTAESIYRISDADLDALAQANNTTPQRLRDQAATRLMGHVLSETSVAIIEPGAREKAFMFGNDARGTASGEIRRSFWQFKSFSVAMAMRHWRRGLAQPGGAAKVKYIGMLMLSTTVLGSMAMQLNSIASGREPEDIDSADFWKRAFLKGGGLGIYGDFLLADQTQYGTSFAGILGGPMLGDIESLYSIYGNVKHKDGDDAAAMGFRFAKSHVPFANLWYTKAITDHLFFNQVQEELSPGYLSRMKSNARKNYGQEYWWQPEDVLPE